MFLLTPVDRGNLASGLGSSHAVPTNAIVPVNAVLVVRCVTSIEPALGAGGATNHHVSAADDAGNVYTKVGECSKEGGAFETSATVSLWLTKVTVELGSGANVTVTFDGAYKARVTSLTEYALEVPEATVAVEAVAVAGGNGTPLTVTLTPAAEDEYTWLLAGGHGLDSGYTVGLDSLFTTDRAKMSRDNGSYESATLWGQYLGLQAASQAWTGSTNTGSVRWVLVLGAVTVTPPPPPPAVAGTREYQADFETATDGVEGVTTDRRPDAVAVDYRTAYTAGPLAIGDLSGGMVARVWRARAVPGSVFLARQNDALTGWDAEVLLTTYTGADIDELDLAFTIDGEIVLVAESGGASPSIAMYWYNPNFPILAYEWRVLGAGRSPRCVADYFPTQVGGNVCPPQVDVQIFYLKTTGGMVRLEQSDGYTAEAVTVLPASSLVRLQKVFRTTDRRVSVLYSQRNVVTGRYQFRRIDSLPYRDSLLVRPTFLNWSSPALDLMQSGEQAFYDPDDTLVTQDWKLRVETNDDVDAIECAGASDYPQGASPVFDQQVQEYAPGGGISAGFYNDFTFSITHGYDAALVNGVMSIPAFRARTRRTVLGVTCYSPWRYMIVPPSYPMLLPLEEDTPVHCDRDVHVDAPFRQNWRNTGMVEGVRATAVTARNDDRPFVCPDPFVTLPLDWFFAGGSRNLGGSYPFPTHFVHYGVRRRAFQDVDFVDEDGIRHYGRVLGTIMQSTTGGTPPEYDWTGFRFPRQFPDDGGIFPPEPTTTNILLQGLSYVGGP